MMLKVLTLILTLVFTNTASADATVMVENMALQCSKSSTTQYLSSCVTNVTYQVTNNLPDNIEANVNCTVTLNYLKSVMGIRDTVQQRAEQEITLAGNSNMQFEMPVTFNFATQSEANNAAIKSVNCRLDASQSSL